MVKKKTQKKGEANDMPSLPTGHTQVTFTGKVGSVSGGHLFKLGPWGQRNALRGS